jgi:hypothetical protein
VKSLGWAAAAGAAIGGVVGYLVIRDAAAQDAIANIAGRIRLPRPGFAMQLPRTADEFTTLESLVCECRDTQIFDSGEPPEAHVSAGATSDDERATAITDCAARRLYPHFPWPPIPGDHPSASELYETLSVLAHRSLAMGCPA